MISSKLRLNASAYDSTPRPSPHLHDSVTLVTAFFSLGKFQKGEGNSHFTPELYQEWMKIFSKIRNPLVAYFDTDASIEVFSQLRSHLPKNLTTIVKINKEQLWAFKLQPQIDKVFNQPGYPKHHPNTVLPQYSCAMHAKYDLLQTVAEDNPYQSRYIAWLDIGYFRDLNSTTTQDFSLYIPPNFDDKRIAYCQVYDYKDLYTPFGIFRNNEVWVGGGFLIATTSVMRQWTRDYMLHVEAFLQHRLMNTDQQVIYAMIQVGKPSIGMQPYRLTEATEEFKDSVTSNAWFYLGYLCKETGKEHDKLIN